MEEYCNREGLNFKLLIPLIQETAFRVQTLSPSQSQTGPAIRRDDNTIEKHLELLEKHPDLKAIYELMSKSIQQHN